MKKQYLEIGKIVNTHGIRGDIKVQPWCDSPDFLAEFDTLYRKDQSPIVITSAKVHKGCVLMHVEGVDTVEQAQALRGMTLYMNRDDVELEEGAFFIQDVIGLPAIRRARRTRNWCGQGNLRRPRWRFVHHSGRQNPAHDSRRAGIFKGSRFGKRPCDSSHD